MVSPPAPSDRRTTVLGVLGGIASGKSHVARLLAGPDGLVLDADRLAHEVLEAPDTVRRLREAFGPGVLGPGGTPDRAALARRVFEDPEARLRLEGWIHPAVRATIRVRVQDAIERGLARVVLDVPLLLETGEQAGLLELCDVLVFVDSDESARERRAAESRGWTPGELRRREAAQMPLQEKRSRAHHVIENRGSMDELEEAVSRLSARLDAV